VRAPRTLAEHRFVAAGDRLLLSEIRALATMRSLSERGWPRRPGSRRGLYSFAPPAVSAEEARALAADRAWAEFELRHPLDYPRSRGKSLEVLTAETTAERRRRAGKTFDQLIDETTAERHRRSGR
jgi:hypothetical protein